jgi:membrane protein YdbS with pleckstrin-like domain
MHDPQTPAPGESIADGREHQLDRRSIRVDQITGAIVSAFVCAGLLVAVVIAGIVGPFGLFGGLVLLGGWIVVSAFLTGAIVAWPPVGYRHTSYQVTEQGIRIRRGVFWRSVATVPRSRVQHTDVSQGPIERAYELATLVMYTAGTQHSSVLLPGLAHETALAIRDHLIAGGEDDAV